MNRLIIVGSPRVDGRSAALAEQLALEEARANKLAWTADAASLEARVPSDELAAEALAVGREDGGILARLAALATGRELKPRAAYAETAVESLASDHRRPARRLRDRRGGRHGFGHRRP